MIEEATSRKKVTVSTYVYNYKDKVFPYYSYSKFYVNSEYLLHLFLSHAYI